MAGEMLARYVCEISVTDPDTKGCVDLVVYKEETGGMFAIDASYITSEEPETVPSVFGNGRVRLVGD